MKKQPNPVNAGSAWTAGEDQQLTLEYKKLSWSKGLSALLTELAESHGRTKIAIWSRLVKLKLVDAKPPYRKAASSLEENPIEPFWMVIKLEGVGSQNTTIRHTSEADAKAEAERLVARYGGCFVILQSIEVCKPVDRVQWIPL